MALASKHTKGITIELGGNATKLKTALDDATKKIRTTQRELDTLKNSLKLEWDASNFKRAQELAQRSVAETAKKAEMLKKALAELEKGGITDDNAEQYEAIKRELSYVQVAAQKAAQELGELNNVKLQALQDRLDAASDRLNKMGDAVMPLSAAMAAGMVGATKAAIDFEDAMAGVAKTTDLSEAELSDMSDEIRQMALTIPVAATELAGITEAAGQLGISKENLVPFTETMANLGVATDMAGDSAATTLAQFANITQMDQSNFGRLGSTIVDLGNNLATTESKIADMAQNMAAAGTQAGMTEADILGLAGTAASLGLEAQAGGTSFSKVINEINVAVETGSKRMEDYAAVAGMTAQDFAAAWKRDAAGALVTFVEGLADVERTGASTAVMLEEMGITEVRMRDALTRAAGAGDLFRDSIDRASQAWDANIALTNEAERKYQTTASQLQLAKNEIIDIGIELGGTLLPIVHNVIDGVKDFTTWFRNLDDSSKKVVLTLVATAAALGPMLKLMGLLSGGASAAITAYKALGPLIDVFRVKTAGAAASQTVLNTAMAANPAGAVITAIGGLIAIVGSFAIASRLAAGETSDLNQKLDETLEKSQKETESIQRNTEEKTKNLQAVSQLLPQIEELNAKTERSAQEQHLLNGLVASANELYPGIIGQINEQTGSYDLNTAAISRNIDAMTRQYQLEGTQSILDEKYRTRVELLRQIEQAEVELQNAQSKKAQREQALAEVMESSTAIHEDRVTANENLAGALENVARQESGVADLYAALEALDGEISATTEEQIALAEAVDYANEKIERATAISAMNADEFSELLNVASGLNSEISVLTEALEEQAAAGSLCEETTKRLEEAGYASAIAHDTETGAAFLNADAYRVLAEEKINEQIATVSDGVRAARAGALAAEEAAVRSLASGNMLLAGTYLAVAAAMKAQAAGAELSIEDLKSKVSSAQIPAGGGSGYKRPSGGGSSGGGRGGGSSAGKGKTQAEKDLEAYKKAMEELDYQRNMDLLSEEEYYKKMGELRDQHLKDNLKERQAADVAIHKYEKKAAEERAKAEEKAIKEAYEDKLADIKYFQDMGLMSEDAYYKSLAALRDAYLEEDSDAWRKANVEIYQYQQKKQEEALKSTADTIDQLSEQINRLTQERIDSIKKQQEAEESRLRSLIDGINEEIAARRRLREEESDQDAVAKARKTLEAAQFQLQYARDDYARAELQKEVIRAKEAYDAALLAKEDNDWLHEKQQEIATLEKQIEASKEWSEKESATAGKWALEQYSGHSDHSTSLSTAVTEAAALQKEAAAALEAATKAAAAAATTISNATTNHNSVTVNTGAAMLTSGQLFAATEKAIERLAR